MTKAPRFEYRVEPLNASHDRAAFRSGSPDLDYYLRHQASQDARRKAAAPFIMVDRNGAIIGYYTLSAYSVLVTELPAAFAKKLPRYPLLPATLLGRLAVGSSYRGQNFGRLLLMDAVHRSWRNTSEVGSVGIVAEALDDAAQAFYLHHEFMQLQDHPDKLFLAMATIERLFARVKPT